MDTTRTIRASGIEFYARQLGAPPRAVFLHGFGDDLNTWDALWSALGDDLPALRYDLRGFGRSVDSGETPFNHADDLLAILDAVEIERCDLVGVSMGGGVALNFALDHPERVRDLVLISPGMVAWEWSAAWKALWWPIVDRARAGAMGEARNLWWEHPLFATTRASGAATILRQTIERFSGAQWVRDNQRWMLPDVERLHALKARTLLLTGARDLDDFKLIADLIEASGAAVKRIVWSDCGHMLHLEDPVGCAREILAFCAVA